MMSYHVMTAMVVILTMPARASMWRLGFDNPPDFNDHQSFCGGFNHQFGQMGGR
jgi:hypothetical protein